MLNDFTGADKVYIACGYTDLRKGTTVWPKFCVNTAKQCKIEPK